MAGETTTTSIIEIVNSEWVNPVIADYARDVFVIGDLCRTIDLRGKATKVGTFVIGEKDSAATIGTEGTTTLSANDVTFAETQVTAAQVGILREPTKLAERTNMLGEAGLLDYIAQDGGYLCGEMMENDLAALFASITASVGTSGSDLTIANLLEALGKRRTGKARGIPVFVLDDEQTNNYQAALAAATATIFSGAQEMISSASDGKLPPFFGAEVRYTNLTDTANAGADVVGACLNWDPGPDNKNSSLGAVILWMPELDAELNVAKSTRLYAINMCYGVGLINDTVSVKIVTDA